MRKVSTNGRTLVAAAVSALMLAAHVEAQQADSAEAPAAEGLQEITVTAQQRSESLQRAAISVDTATAQTLADAGVSDIADLTYLVPALTISSFNGPYVNYTVRGIGNFTTSEVADNSVVVNTNGVPIARPSGSHGIFFDLDRVEVLKGPQGTLYGRNATGGVINVIPRAPGNELSADLHTDFGNYNEMSMGGGADIPLSDTLTTRAAFESVRHAGYNDDGTGDQDDQEGRFTLRYRPNSDLDLSVVADAAHEGGKGPGSSLLNAAATGLGGYVVGPRSGQFNSDPRQAAAYLAAGGGIQPRNPADSYLNNLFWGVTGTLKWNLGFADLTSIIAHRETDLDYVGSVAASYYGEFGEAHQDSLEMRLASNSTGKLQWLAGIFTLRDIGNIMQDSEQGTGLSVSKVSFANKTYAGFGNITYSLLDSLRVAGSVRVNKDDKENNSPRYTIANYPFTTLAIGTQPGVNASQYVGNIDKSDAFNSVTWKAGFEYDVADNSLAYANVGTGFKAGGFAFGPPGGGEFQPEKVTAYTLGSKNRFLENRLQLNAELYYMKYRDQQISYLASLPSIGNFTVTQNIGSSTLYGLDFDSIYLVTSTTRLNLNVQLEKTKYDSLSYVSPSNPVNQTCPSTPVTGGFSVSCGGKPLVNAPRAVVQGGIDQTAPLPNGGRLVGAVVARYESARETQLNYLPETHAPSYHKTDLTLTYFDPTDKWHVQAYVQNVENVDVPGLVLVGRTYNIKTGGLISTSLEAPRTFGVRIAVDFK